MECGAGLLCGGFGNRSGSPGKEDFDGRPSRGFCLGGSRRGGGSCGGHCGGYNQVWVYGGGDSDFRRDEV